MLKINPKYVLRNHLGEQAIRAAKLKDFSVVRDLLAVLENPFDEHPAFDAWAGFPPDWAHGIEISCSSRSLDRIALLCFGLIWMADSARRLGNVLRFWGETTRERGKSVKLSLGRFLGGPNASPRAFHPKAR